MKGRKMKSQTLILTVLSFLAFSLCAFAQFDLEKKIKKKLEREAEKEVDKGIDKGYEETKDVILNSGDEEGEDNEQPEKDNTNVDTDVNDNSDQILLEKNSRTELKMWSKYDFVAGDKIIFEDDLLIEENGEFPSRWDLLSGSAEVASLGGENVIHLTHNNSIILPLMDKKDFLTDVFTIEFDVFFEKDGATRSDIYKVRFFEGTNNSSRIDGNKLVTPVEIKWNEVKMGQFGGKTKTFTDERKNWQPQWKHVAIAFNKRSLKLYMNEERLLNIPNLGYKPKMFSIGGHFDDRYIKMSSIRNIRVNEGGKKLYDRILAEGKFVTTGIRFDVNRATLKPVSMGVINKIAKLMKEHSDINFSVQGHTDSDGDDVSNQKLSEARANSVKNALVDLGIDASRLETKGYGESNPVNENSTPEGKANNRRVEFVKI
jgi:outer membrane protein OmpA-like peptidoglycan-associated protein